MKNIYKNPLFYYVVIPAVAALWPLLVGGVYLPAAERALNNDMVQYAEAQKTIDGILKLDPGRRDFSGDKQAEAEFEYFTAVDAVARLVEIPSANYELSSKPPRTSKRQKTQTCHLELKDVSIENFARFLSLIQLRWTNLECTKVVLTKRKDQADSWKVALDFRYIF